VEPDRAIPDDPGSAVGSVTGCTPAAIGSRA
jgi:hypothetical protein